MERAKAIPATVAEAKDRRFRSRADLPQSGVRGSLPRCVMESSAEDEGSPNFQENSAARRQNPFSPTQQRASCRGPTLALHEFGGIRPRVRNPGTGAGDGVRFGILDVLADCLVANSIDDTGQEIAAQALHLLAVSDLVERGLVQITERPGREAARPDIPIGRDQGPFPWGTAVSHRLRRRR